MPELTLVWAGGRVCRHETLREGLGSAVGHMEWKPRPHPCAPQVLSLYNVNTVKALPTPPRFVEKRSNWKLIDRFSLGGAGQII